MSLDTLPNVVGQGPGGSSSWLTDISSIMSSVFYFRKTTAGASQVKAGSGLVIRLINGGVAPVTTLTLYDSLTASGPVIGTLRTVKDNPFVYEIGCKFTTGLTIASVDATDVTLIYR